LSQADGQSAEKTKSGKGKLAGAHAGGKLHFDGTDTVNAILRALIGQSAVAPAVVPSCSLDLGKAPAKKRARTSAAMTPEPTLSEVYQHFEAYTCINSIPLIYLPRTLSAGKKSYNITAHCGSRILVRLDTECLWMSQSCTYSSRDQLEKPHTVSFKRHGMNEAFEDVTRRICSCDARVWNPKFTPTGTSKMD